MRCDLQYSDIDVKIIELDCKLYKYSELSQEKLNKCLLVSDDSMKLLNRIYYNDNMIEGKIRFSIMHELGHMLLGHGDYKNDIFETEANYCSSHILAPRMAIHYSGCKNHVNVAKLFNISFEAAQIAFDDYRRWHRRAAYKMDRIDKVMYSYFYNDEYKGFVYNIKTCRFCGKKLLNEKSDYCESCFNKLSYIDYAKIDKYFFAAENTWLYGGIY